MLDDAAKRTVARIAVAEVQKLHAVWSMAQLRFEVHRALPVLSPGTDGQAVVDEVARLAVCGRVGTDVVQITAPDPADVTSLGRSLIPISFSATFARVLITLTLGLGVGIAAAAAARLRMSTARPSPGEK